MSYKVMLDMDGVVHSFVDAVRSILVDNAPNPYMKFHAIHSPPFQWSFWKDWGFGSVEAIELININVEKAFSYPVLSTNAQFIRDLDDCFDTVIVSTPWGENDIRKRSIEAKKKWLDNIGFCGDIKFSDCKLGDWDLVIEDTPEHAIKAYESGSKVIFVTHPYNLEGAPACKGLDESKIRRVNWGELTIDTVHDVLSS